MLKFFELFYTYSTNVFMWFIWIGILFIIYKTVNLIESMSKYFTNKAINYYADTLIKENPTDKLLFKLNSTEKLREEITHMVEYEVNSLLVAYKVLNQPYEFTKLDTDIESVSTKIFQGITENTFKDTSIIYNEDYLMHLIIDQSRIGLLAGITAYNEMIRS